MSLRCRSCGKLWEEGDERASHYFSSASLKKGSYSSPKDIAALGEDILTCPVDPIEDLDEALFEGDRVQDLESDLSDDPPEL